MCIRAQMVLTLQDVKALLEHQWRCRYREKETGDSVIHIIHSLQIDSNWNYTAEEATIIIRKRRQRMATTRVKGNVSYNQKDRSIMVTYKEYKVIQEDELPMGGRWCRCKGVLHLYRDGDHPGSYFLEGDLTPVCDEGPIDKQHLVFR